ncbi:gamma-glutamyltranspeptidase [Erwinia pyrifoliae DSM 12163]|nr:Gamma-glutamyltranspeptidase, N-terminal fragment [Erwinia pyrifoliae Ep1/96]CAY76110.1 gamma-glutamyltranspeptidase [Erwinia pyrifoliae DSM 12163]
MVTYTLNTNSGSGIVAGNSGILLNNEMDDFSAKPGTPNVYWHRGSPVLRDIMSHNTLALFAVYALQSHILKPPLEITSWPLAFA